MKKNSSRTTQIKRSLPVLLLPLALALFAFHSENENPPDSECVQTVSFDMETQSYYVIQDTLDIPNITELDKVRLKRTTEKQHYKICTDENGELTIEITVLRPNSDMKSWMTQVWKTVIDKDSVTVYDSVGTLLLKPTSMDPY